MSDAPPTQPLPRPAGGTIVRPLTLPGQVPPEASVAALERLMEAWIMASTINRAHGDIFRMALKIAVVAAPYGAHGPACEKVIQALTKRLEQHLATLPDAPRPPAA